MSTAVLLSGGVDSSVALWRLREEGVDGLKAFYLKVWLEDELAYLGDCPWEEDLAYARAVCEAVSVPLDVVPLQREYYRRVVAYTLEELRSGRTPSSDVLCNQQVKFGAFIDHIDPIFEKVASGHYARVEEENGRYLLLRSPDPVKDQTYFLSRLSQAQLARCLFPLGDFTKAEVRQMARELRLPNCDRPDSQGICFLGKIPFQEFVRHHLGERPGEIREWGTDRVLGNHSGYWFYTIGQRRGLGLSGGPWYVVERDLIANIVYVVHRDAITSASPDTFEVADLHWITEPPREDRLQVKIRHGERTYRCSIGRQRLDRLSVVLDCPDPGIAPGQFAVFYRGVVCLGSGMIQ